VDAFKSAIEPEAAVIVEQHVFWTRMTVNSIIARHPDEAATTARLLKNAGDFAEAFAPYYGQAIANRLGEHGLRSASSCGQSVFSSLQNKTEACGFLAAASDCLFDSVIARLLS